ncbi:MAG: S8 family serine peptidase [Reyranella sp.]|uniref:S8 family serine peptidase n=1 Tax=Reyranella sp. TaxID=1929291 RepID=UPI003D10AFB5
MAQDKDERTTGSGGRRAAEAEDRKVVTDRASPRVAGESGNGQALQPGRHQYVVALRAPTLPIANLAPRSPDAAAEFLKRQDGIEIVARLKTPGSHPGVDAGQDAVLVRMTEDKAESLRAATQGQIVVEQDRPLSLADGARLPMPGASTALPLTSVGGELSLRIVGERDQPLSRAAVVAFGPGIPVQAVTDDSGIARFSLFGSTADLVEAVYVRPKANCWEQLLVAPDLNGSGPATVRLRPLAESFPALAAPAPVAGSTPGPEHRGRVVQWGQRLMRMDQRGILTGAGVRVAIIGSGCDNSHPALRHVIHGRDFTRRQNENGRSDAGWSDDVLGYGTHSTGLVGAVPGTGPGISGGAPGAELHAFKVFPGGRLSDLLAALDECMAREIDVVSLGVGSPDGSELLDRKLSELRHKGIACIVAAGTFGGPLQYPAVLQGVLAVGAVGRLGEFPPDTCHARTIMSAVIGNDGIFPAEFSGVGPHVAVSAPGVAVLSTVPGGHAALDGTGLAAAQVSAMAALILAHHPLFQGPLKSRSEQRVAALFRLIQASAVPQFADPLRGGAGVPDLQRVPGLPGAMMPMPYSDLPGVAQLVTGQFVPGQSFPGQPLPGLSSPLGPEASPYAFGYAPGWHAMMQMRAAGLI